MLVYFVVVEVGESCVGVFLGVHDYNAGSLVGLSDCQLLSCLKVLRVCLSFRVGLSVVVISFMVSMLVWAVESCSSMS